MQSETEKSRPWWLIPIGVGLLISLPLFLNFLFVLRLPPLDPQGRPWFVDSSNDIEVACSTMLLYSGTTGRVLLGLLAAAASVSMLAGWRLKNASRRSREYVVLATLFMALVIIVLGQFLAALAPDGMCAGSWHT